ncbi:hypothetical protein LY76DRAFT_686445 [Colletotrichum caudatum]|nr:hypothetical protein LY76DRAFT_686445 [Colletotrichum caudatum]
MSTTGRKGMEKIAQSPIIQFLVGDERTMFYVHVGSVVGLSERIDNKIIRSSCFPVLWEDIDVGTFATFLEYAYTGNFTIMDRKIPHDSEEPPSLCESMASCESTESESTKYALKHFGSVLRQTCSENDAVQHVSALPTTTVPHSRGYYVAHARLYVFAEEYELDELKSLCVEKMRQSLAGNPGQVELTHAVVDVLRFIWPQTKSQDAMRKLFLRYILTDMGWMMKQPVFNKLLKDMPQISHELLFTVPLAYWEAL